MGIVMKPMPTNMSSRESARVGEHMASVTGQRGTYVQG